MYLYIGIFYNIEPYEIVQMLQNTGGGLENNGISDNIVMLSW